MEFDILDSLDDLRYSKKDLKDSKLSTIIEAGPKSVEFTQLVEWFSKELQTLLGLESCVNSITDLEDCDSFLLEVSSFLKELQCPYKSLISGNISDRLQDSDSRKVLLDFLCTELQAVHVIQRKTKSNETVENEVEENDIISSVNDVLEVLDIKVDCVEEPLTLLSQIEEKISSQLDVVLPPALEEPLTEDNWSNLTQFYQDMFIEYSIRREMMLTRLDVTLQSFKWGDRCKGKESQILSAYVRKRNKLKREPSVKLSDLAAAREDIFIIEKTSSANLVKNTKSSVNRVLINAVPDRGGRPKEQTPYKEMPNWSKRSGGGGGSGRGGPRGGGSSHSGKRFKEHKGGGKNRGAFDAAGSY
ncbi:protein FAM98B [Parasteatoda tepidariorum]|uniref:protein FAM98B n=1 Tax=Parasteatoda tepidariorum TaxID=114398 RepID=UPI001C7264F9|nr:protein FAM98B [Parasteatoda tepidariorum]